MKYTEESNWNTIHGETKKLKDIDDTHLVNLYHWAQDYHDPSLKRTLNAIARKRGIKKEFLTMGPIPYQNPKGEWVIMKADRTGLIVLSKPRPKFNIVCFDIEKNPMFKHYRETLLMDYRKKIVIPIPEFKINQRKVTYYFLRYLLLSVFSLVAGVAFYGLFLEGQGSTVLNVIYLMTFVLSLKEAFDILKVKYVENPNV